ncbi:putative enterotoxin [Ophiocordyceps australis]|uniref:Putative enterotoxin n=1 Tax=Ophiocordyceps australis TaxID=1399860 RepID=A0A2C5Z1Q1_9HYPO|nr:putative enterotoxin [Ophiocordyceps australis]
MKKIQHLLLLAVVHAALCLAQATPRGGTSRPSLKPRKIVFRGESRSPGQIQLARGFLPFSQDQPTADSFSIWRHIINDISDEDGNRETAYVTTTSSLHIGVLQAGLDRMRGWVYVIRATPNIFDAVGSLNPGNEYANEEQYLATMGIRWEQVVGWMPVVDLQVNKTHYNDDRVVMQWHDEQNLTFTPNAEYNFKYEAYAASGPQPQLAGFYGKMDKYKARAPWRAYQAKSLLEYGFDFMDANGAAVGWTGHAPLFVGRVPVFGKSWKSDINESFTLDEAMKLAPEQWGRAMANVLDGF